MWGQGDHNPVSGKICEPGCQIIGNCVVMDWISLDRIVGMEHSQWRRYFFSWICDSVTVNLALTRTLGNIFSAQQPQGRWNVSILSNSIINDWFGQIGYCQVGLKWMFLYASTSVKISPFKVTDHIACAFNQWFNHWDGFGCIWLVDNCSDVSKGTELCMWAFSKLDLWRTSVPSQHITSKQQYLRKNNDCVCENLCLYFWRTPTSHPFEPNWDSEKSFICLHKAPLFLFLSCDWSETKLQRSKETLLATSPSLSMKRGSGRSVNMIKKTGNLLAVKNIVPPFTQALMCLVLYPWRKELLSSCVPLMLLTPACLLSVCLSGKLYIFNWLRGPFGS